MTEGYTILTGVSSDYEEAAGLLQTKVREAEAQFDITFLWGNVKFDDNVAYRASPVYHFAQACILKAK